MPISKPAPSSVRWFSRCNLSERELCYSLRVERAKREAALMASWQAHLAVWITKWRVKRRLRGVRDYRVARKIFRTDPYKVPASVNISPDQVGGVPGEWVQKSDASKSVLLYLHGGGYFGCSPQTHRPITVSFALHGFL